MGATQWELSVDLLDVMDSQNLSPDIITYNSVLSACGQFNLWVRSLQLLSDMGRRGLAVSAQGYVAGLRSSERSQEIRLALAMSHSVRAHAACSTASGASTFCK